jgi:hypothetical protein
MTSFTEETSENIPMVTTEYGTYEYRNFVRERIYAARKKARQARFEYGETPEVRGYR